MKAIVIVILALVVVAVIAHVVTADTDVWVPLGAAAAGAAAFLKK